MLAIYQDTAYRLVNSSLQGGPVECDLCVGPNQRLTTNHMVLLDVLKRRRFSTKTVHMFR